MFEEDRLLILPTKWETKLVYQFKLFVHYFDGQKYQSKDCVFGDWEQNSGASD